MVRCNNLQYDNCPEWRSQVGYFRRGCVSSLPSCPFLFLALSLQPSLDKKLCCRRAAAQYAYMLRVCQLASTLQYPERSRLLLVTSSSDLPLRTIKFCSVVFGVTAVVL